MSRFHRDTSGSDDAYQTTSPEQLRFSLPPNQACLKCRQRPRHHPYDFCSKECGRMCELPDCQSPKYAARGSRFCSHACRKAAVQAGVAKACVVCGEWPQLEEQGSVYCGAICTRKASLPSPVTAKPELGSATNVPLGDRTIVPRNPNPHTRPRSAFQLEFGGYNGEPNYLLRSKRGIDWTNLPPDLHTLCVQLRQKHENILDFALGPEGRYYITYKDGPDVRANASPGLWTELNEDFRKGGLRQLEFGAEGIVWGIKAWRDYTRSPHSSMPNLGRTNSAGSGSGVRNFTVMEEPFGNVPDSLYQQAQEVYPNLACYGDVDFVSIGVDGSWVMGILGKHVFWDNVEAKAIKQLTDVWQVAGSIRNVELSPVRPDIYFIEPAEGKVAYHVPDAWFPYMREHFSDQYRLDYEPKDTTPFSFPKPARPGTGGQGQPLARRGTSASSGRGPGRGAGSSGSGGGGGGPSNFHRSYPHGPPGPPYQPYNNGPPPAQGPPQQSSIYQYANNTQTSGTMHGQQQSSGAGWRIATEIIKATPAIIGAGVQIAALSGAACVIM
ncbi:hypothetical protein FRB95_004589 [Tulasnella sp. JGI-2019a]|nr:hypothetical protein FRB93_002964 [Tulasnella sp. JGI-2019a]KAG9030055.1 hypothetical protein FRB95_004589 [Tulasnella sp. JGI-2019a]